jgi:beta-galactosidase
MLRSADRWTKVWVIAGFTVFLVMSPLHAAVTIEQVLPFTPAVDSARVQVKLASDSQATPNLPRVDLTGVLTPAGQKEEVWKGDLGHADVPTKGAATAETMLEKLNVKPWSPGAPNLYELTVTATEKGKKVASKTVRFGFRTFESKNGNFYLNGKPIFLRGLAINPPDRGVPKELGSSRQFAHDYVKYLRSQNLNLIRVNESNQDWFDVCDELGMMLDQGFYASPPTGMTKEEEAAQKSLSDQEEAVGKKLPKDFDRSMKAYQTEFETYVRHPSIVIYILSNEMPYKGKSGEAVHDFLTKAYEHLSKWDHTRLYIGNAGYGEGHEGDCNDVHRYWGWYYNSFLTYYNLRDSKLFGDAAKNQPFTFSECVGNFTGPTGAYNYIERKQLAAALGWTGHASNQVDEAQKYQGMMVQQATESFRRLREINPRISGLMPFTITFHNWRGIKSFDQMKPTAAATQFGTSYSPVLLSWESWQSQVYAGTKPKLFAHVVNDADDFSNLAGATLSYEVKGKADKPVASGKLDLPTIPYYAAQRFDIPLDLPDTIATGQYTLVGTIKSGGKMIATNQMPLYIAAKETPVSKSSTTAKSKPKQRVILFDPTGKTAAALEKLGVKFDQAGSLSKIEPGGLLIIGEETLDKNADSKSLTQFASAGGRVLILGQKFGAFDPAFLPGGVTMLDKTVTDPEYGSQVERPAYDQTHINPERPDHPVFANIGRDQMTYWSDYTNWDQTKPGFPRISPVRFGYKLTKQEDLSKIAILADYDRGLEAVALAEFFEGKGSTMLVGLDIVGRAGLDPIADRMLTNLVTYMASGDKHDIHPKITEPIKWGQFATERGLVNGPLSGFFYNADWVPPPTEPDAKPITDAQSWWNTRPSDQFLPVGIRPRGSFKYTFNCAPRDEDKSETGSGIFYAQIPAGRSAVVTRVRNDLKSAATLQVDVNDAKGKPASVPAGQTIVIRTPIPSRATTVGVRYTGNKELIILETKFE